MATASTKNAVTGAVRGKKKKKNKWKRLNSNNLDIVVVSIPNSMLKTNRSKHLVQRILSMMNTILSTQMLLLGSSLNSFERHHAISSSLPFSVKNFSLLCRLYPIFSSLKCAHCFYQVCFFPLSFGFCARERSVSSDKPIDCCSVTFKLNHLVVLFHSTKFDIPKWFVSFHWISDTHMHMLAMQNTACIWWDLSFSKFKLGTISTCAWQAHR